MKHVLYGCLFALLCAACSTPPPAKTENPPTRTETKAEPSSGTRTTAGLHPWAAFNVGSYAKTKTVVNTTEGGKPTVLTSTITYTMLEKTSDKAVVEMDTVTMGSQTKIKNEIPLSSAGNLALGNMRAPATPKQEGVEDVTVNGQVLPCRWMEIENNEGNPFSMKVWISQQVPGLIVKSHTKMGGSNPIETTVELVEFAAK
ncbi:MAG: hypothetical protein K1Y36_12930 [Blastocatellia bacterium]|nr:hypothetical protein [Blastocatellia bacterium]